MARELTAMANSEEDSRWKPMNRQPARNSGIFSRIVKMPTGSTGSRTLMACARPVMPPMPTAFAAKNQSKASAKITAPSAMMA